jgi:NhaP-type Na+/H+ or K+/H+ antiporter
MPMVFVAAGFVLGPGSSNLLPLSPRSEAVKALTELTLAILLFADASTLVLRQVQQDKGLPVRLLAIGLPITIALGAGVAYALHPAEGLAFAFLLAAVLAPTDAALGLPIFNNPRVPVRIRRALNVESGLNDGIATPFVLMFLALTVATEDGRHQHWVALAAAEITLAVIAGSVIGIAGSWVLRRAIARGWTSGGAVQLAILGLALGAYYGSLAIGGNGFIAAFVGGIMLRATGKAQMAEPAEFVETTGTFLSLIVWAIFGAALIPHALVVTQDWRPLAYAVASLTFIRMVPVALALVGTGLRPDTRALMGWFGPRGLASVVFTLLAVIRFEEVGRGADVLLSTATWTILLSVMLHGLSAVPLANWYARRLAQAPAPPAELEDLPELSVREVLGGLAGGLAPATSHVPPN